MYSQTVVCSITRECCFFKGERSCGRLAGGVAHDYNNMLAVIFINIELAKKYLSPHGAGMESLLEIQKAAERSRDITRQLLAFSRKQLIRPQETDLNAIIGSLGKSLSRLIGEDIELRFALKSAIGKILIDPSQIDQVLVNLVVNARDAMPNGGKLSIETSTFHADEAYCRTHVDCRPGRYVRLTIADDGVGIDQETLSHIFEPFFTTKDVGQGTGLGLAMVYGIVRQNGGMINVYSEIGSGTVFHVCFPEIETEALEPVEPCRTDIPHGSASILLVEDDDMLRSSTAKALLGLGYRITAAAAPHEALQYAGSEAIHLDLVLSDIVMPKMNGAQLSGKISALRPGIKTLFMSGYTADVIDRKGILEPDVDFIQKPFSIPALARKIDEILNCPSPQK